MIGIIKPKYTARSTFYLQMKRLENDFQRNKILYARTQWHFVVEGDYSLFENMSLSHMIGYYVGLKEGSDIESIRIKVLEIEIEARNCAARNSIKEAMPIAEKRIYQLVNNSKLT